jgi:NTP pyrophosphatase (non-canonical NTP hydrolase)
MKPEEFIEAALATESMDKEEIGFRLDVEQRLVHAAMGMLGEAAEFSEQVKKRCFYGSKLDAENLHEELGDLLYYVAIALDELGLSFEGVMAGNIRKLAKRYPEGFKKIDAENRDTEAEMAAIFDGGFNDEAFELHADEFKPARKDLTTI